MNQCPYIQKDGIQFSKQIFSLKANFWGVASFVYIFCLIFNPGLFLVVNELLWVLVYFHWMNYFCSCCSINFFNFFVQQLISTHHNIFSSSVTQLGMSSSSRYSLYMVYFLYIHPKNVFVTGSSFLPWFSLHYCIISVITICAIISSLFSTLAWTNTPYFNTVTKYWWRTFHYHCKVTHSLNFSLCLQYTTLPCVYRAFVDS